MRHVDDVDRPVDVDATADRPRNTRRHSRARNRGIASAHRARRAGHHTQGGRVDDRGLCRTRNTVGVDAREDKDTRGIARIERCADRGRPRRTTLVHHTTAVVVEQVTADLRRTGIDRCVGGAAVVVVRHLTRRTNRARDDVDRASTVTIVVGVGVAIGRHAAFVHQGIAVVVDLITAELGRVGVGGRRCIVAVAICRRGTRGTHGCAVHEARSHTVAIRVSVRVARDTHTRQVLVDHTVAVVVDHVANLQLEGVLRRIGVVAVRVVRHATSGAGTVDL